MLPFAILLLLTVFAIFAIFILALCHVDCHQLSIAILHMPFAFYWRFHKDPRMYSNSMHFYIVLTFLDEKMEEFTGKMEKHRSNIAEDPIIFGRNEEVDMFLAMVSWSLKMK